MDSSQGDAYTCPSFSSYSSNRLAETAVKVAGENSNNGGDEDFEFALVRIDDDVSAEKLVCDGHTGRAFPVFNRNLLLNSGEFSQSSENKQLESSITVPLSKLLIKDRELDNPPSCSSSEDDELEDVPARTYCVWRPKPVDQPSPSRCKKSKSTGSASKRWKFSDLLRRSNSEGKDSFVFLTPKKREEKPSSEAPKKAKGKTVRGSPSGGAPGSPSAHEALYIRNRAAKQGDKKKSYLPYRQVAVGFFVNVNGLDRSFPHF